MARDVNDDNGCDVLKKLLDDNNLKGKLLQKEVNGEWLFFIEILSSLKKTPCSYIPTSKTTKCVLIRKEVADSEDGLVWDWYLMHCPTGPPCDFLENL